MHLIKIDRTTIKKNDNAGQTQLLIPGRATETKVILICLDTLCNQYLNIEGSGHITKKVTIVDGYVTNIESLTDQELQLDGYKKVYNRELDEYILNHTKERPVETINLLQPIPNYSAQYEPQIIECEHCNEQFDFTELTSEDFDDYSLTNICPKCKTPNCCDIKFEELDSETGIVLECEHRNISNFADGLFPRCNDCGEDIDK